MPSLLVYEDGTSVMEFSEKETLLHQKIWSGLRYKTPEGIELVTRCIVLLEMHKHRHFNNNSKH